MPRRHQTALLAVHDTKTAGSVEAREAWLEYDAGEASLDFASRAPADYRRPAATVRSRPLGVLEDTWSRKDYEYLHACSYRLACRARQRGSSCIISVPPHCGSNSGGGGGGATVCMSGTGRARSGACRRIKAVLAAAGAYDDEKNSRSQQGPNAYMEGVIAGAGAGADDAV